MNAYFVTGTDTGVGKTTVSMSLLAAAARRRLRTGCMKPVESGCERAKDSTLIPADAQKLGSLSSTRLRIEQVCPYRFEDPVAPGVAAENEGVVIDFERIQRGYTELIAQTLDFVLVEGAGGLLVPMGQGRTIADLAHTLAIPLLIVGRPGLGTINHTLLTIEVATLRGLSVAGFLFSRQLAESDGLESSNADEIERATQVPFVGCLPRLMCPCSACLADAAEVGLDCDRLMQN